MSIAEEIRRPRQPRAAWLHVRVSEAERAAAVAAAHVAQTTTSELLRAALRAATREILIEDSRPS